MEEQAGTRAPQIYSLLPRVMKSVGAIGKGKTNAHFKFKFRGIDDALNHVQPALVEHGVSVSVQVDDHTLNHGVDKKGQGVTVATLVLSLTFYAPDGSLITNRIPGEARDTGSDKATNKALAAAMKYGLFFGLCLPVDDKSIEDSDRS